MPTILTEIFRGMPLTEEQAERMLGKLVRRQFRKGDYLLRPGETVTDLYFIREGCLRTYFIDPAGREHTLQFGIAGWWISDYIALFDPNRRTAVSYVECLRDATTYSISKQDFDALCEDLPQVRRFHAANLEAAFAAFQHRILENLTLSAKERYVGFVRTYPAIEQLVKNYHVASYLGITTESLSRIRKELSRE